MTKYSRSLLFIALFCSLSCLALSTATDRVSAAHPLHPEVAPDNSRVLTIQFESKLVGKPLPYQVLLPYNPFAPVPPQLGGQRHRRYDPRHFPVLYLLHGWGGNHDQLTAITKLSDYSRAYRMIVVMPEGNFGWYTDSATIPKDKYESYILKELIPDVERRLRAAKSRRGRSIAGLSMGGYGALKFGVKHPDKFVFVGSMSGAVNVTSRTKADLEIFGDLGLKIWNTILPAFGPVGSKKRAANDLYKLYGELPIQRIADLPYIYLDCGKEDYLRPANRSLADLLLARKIPLEYHEPPGDHNAVYWDKQVQEVLRIADREMHKPLKRRLNWGTSPQYRHGTSAMSKQFEQTMPPSAKLNED